MKNHQNNEYEEVPFGCGPPAIFASFSSQVADGKTVTSRVFVQPVCAPLSANPTLTLVFQRQGALARDCEHPALSAPHALLYEEPSYLVLGGFPGASLANLGSPLSLPAVASVVRAGAGVLGELHAACAKVGLELVHSALKPEHFGLSFQGQPIVHGINAFPATARELTMWLKKSVRNVDRALLDQVLCKEAEDIRRLGEIGVEAAGLGGRTWHWHPFARAFLNAAAGKYQTGNALVAALDRWSFLISQKELAAVGARIPRKHFATDAPDISALLKKLYPPPVPTTTLASADAFVPSSRKPDRLLTTELEHEAPISEARTIFVDPGRTRDEHEAPTVIMDLDHMREEHDAPTIIMDKNDVDDLARTMVVAFKPVQPAKTPYPADPRRYRHVGRRW